MVIEMPLIIPKKVKGLVESYVADCVNCGVVQCISDVHYTSQWPLVQRTLETPVKAGVQAARPMPVREAGIVVGG